MMAFKKTSFSKYHKLLAIQVRSLIYPHDIQFVQRYHFIMESETSEDKTQTFLVQKMEEYLRSHPSPSSIEYINPVFKLTHTYSTPYTDSKNAKETLLVHQQLQQGRKVENPNRRLSHNAEKGRIEERGSFDSITSKGKHQKLMQDDVFGQAQYSRDCSKWTFIAEIKQEEIKSIFNEGKGNRQYKHDFGSTYDNVREVGLFVWDKPKKQLFRIPIDQNLIPCYPSFSNSEGSQIIFHAYKKQNFGHGILFCFNKPVSIYQVKFQKIPKDKEDKKEENKKEEEKKDVKAEVVELFEKDTQVTKIFPALSPCLNYLVYLSGTGQTHTFYKDYVICKKKQGQWIQTYRTKEKIIGYNETLNNYIIEQDNKIYGITQTMQKASAQIYRFDLQSGESVNLTQQFKNHDFQIDNIDQGIIVGTVTTNKFNSFFFVEKGKVNIISPAQTEEFNEEEYDTPIHSVLLSAKEDIIWPEYKDRLNKRPLLVMPHGGPHGSFTLAVTCMRYMLLRMGYYLLQPNFSGSTGYGKEFLEASLTKIGEVDANQIIQTLKKTLKDHPNISSADVHTMGGSYGGYMSAILGSRYPEYFKSAVIMNGVLDLIANMWFVDIPEWNTVEALGSSQIHGLTLENYQAMWRQSPSSQQMKIPVLQILGGKDRRVGWRQGLFYDAITKNAGTPIFTYVYENSGHSLADSVETTLDIIVKTLLFLETSSPEKPEKKQVEKK